MHCKNSRNDFHRPCLLCTCPSCAESCYINALALLHVKTCARLWGYRDMSSSAWTRSVLTSFGPLALVKPVGLTAEPLCCNTQEAALSSAGCFITASPSEGFIISAVPYLGLWLTLHHGSSLCRWGIPRGLKPFNVLWRRPLPAVVINLIMKDWWLCYRFKCIHSICGRRKCSCS